MFIEWDYDKGTICSPPSTAQEDGWLPLIMPGKRQSRAQELTYSLVGGTVVSEWVGSSEPSDAGASRESLDQALELILQLPLAAVDGKVFQFDTKSESIMSKIVVFLKANSSLTTDWRLLDNSSVTVNGAQLEAYYNELILAQATRGFMVDPQYLNYKNNGVTVAELAAWVKTYEDNPDITTIA